MRAATGRTRRGRCGAAAAELAVVTPVLLLMALGCVDFGRFAYDYIALHGAVRAGAEYATTNPYTSSGAGAWQTKVKAAVSAELAGQHGFDATKLTVPNPTVTVEGTNQRRVRVQATYTGFETLVSWPGIPSNPTMAAAVTMRAIR